MVGMSNELMDVLLSLHYFLGCRSIMNASGAGSGLWSRGEHWRELGLGGRGLMGLMGPIGAIGLISLISLIGLIGLISLISLISLIGLIGAISDVP